jgi:hypothetical protein
MYKKTILFWRTVTVKGDVGCSSDMAVHIYSDTLHQL